MILLDGLGDRAYRRLGGKTPLQAARTPTLDRLASAGANGLYHASMQGEALPSENAHFAIFGFEPEVFPGRGPLEALGANIPFGKDDAVFLGRFAALKRQKNTLALFRDRVDFNDREATQLAALAGTFSSGGIRVTFERTFGIHGVVVLSGDVSACITDTDPLYEGRHLIEPRPWHGHRDDPAAVNSAAALKAYLLSVHRRLETHEINHGRMEAGTPPINGLITHRGGQLKSTFSFSRRYGLKGLTIASGLVYKGLARYVGLDVRTVKDSDRPGDDLAGRLAIAKQALTDYDFIHLHTKAPDEAGHRKDPLLKRKVIEALDKGLAESIGSLLDDPELLIVVTADHATPSAGPLIHSGETVPLLFHGRGVRVDGVRRFDEVSAAGGALSLVKGRELILLILNHLDRAKLHGLMDMPMNQPYWPGDSEPFNCDETVISGSKRINIAGER